jgi:uncharacterized protein YkwD
MCAWVAAGCCGAFHGMAAADDGMSPPARTRTRADCGLPDFKAALLARVNRWRATGGDCGGEGHFGPAPALMWSDTLMQAAAAHSRDMAARDFFSHTGSDGRTLGQRVHASGYAWRSVAENIAVGEASVARVVDGWIASAGHCANLLSADFSEVGAACVPGQAGSPHAAYWTMDLARRR